MMRHLHDAGETAGGPAAGAESPSLFAPGADGPPAYELKFLLPEDQARAVAAAVAARLAPDPHADPALGNAYRTTTLYTDTPGLEVLAGRAGRRKFRVRRYGAGDTVFLERKIKAGDRVWKRRSAVPVGELTWLAGDVSPPDWAGAWFQHRLAARGLRPVCRVTYERVAYHGAADDGPVRVTFDRGVRGRPTDGWAVEPVGPAPCLLAGRVICEFKFRRALPGLLKGLVADLGLAPAGVSKYRLAMRAHPGGPTDA